MRNKLAGEKSFMRYVAALIMGFVFLAGIALLCGVARDLALHARRAPYMKRAEGEIIKIEIEKRTRRSRTSRPLYEYEAGVPVISFQTQAGETIVFKSQLAAETSKLDKLDLHVGKKIAVVYDPENKLPPRVDSFLVLLGLPALAIFGFMMTATGFLFFKFFWWDELRRAV